MRLIFKKRCTQCQINVTTFIFKVVESFWCVDRVRLFTSYPLTPFRHDRVLLLKYKLWSSRDLISIKIQYILISWFVFWHERDICEVHDSTSIFCKINWNSRSQWYTLVTNKPYLRASSLFLKCYEWPMRSLSSLNQLSERFISWLEQTISKPPCNCANVWTNNIYPNSFIIIL